MKNSLSNFILSMPPKKDKNTKAYSNLNRGKLVRGGKEYFDTLLQLIDNAKESIHLQTYIFGNDKTGRMVADALKNAAKRKVQVYLMADGFASNSLPDEFTAELESNGINFRFFEPVFKSSNFYVGRRMHHKVLVVDTWYAMVGGVNIADRYNDIDGIPAWLDFAVHIQGDIAKQLCILCWKTWKGFPVKIDISTCEKKQSELTISESDCCDMRMRRNDWVRRKNEISASYKEMLRHSKSQVTILCSYFLPGKMMRRQIRLATRRGVQVRVIAAGISDVKVAKYAERWLYDWLLRNKVELYEYQKTVLHGKLAVCDDAWITIGSYNINDLSAYASIELNIDIKDPKIAGSTRKMMDEIIANDCIHITEQLQNKTNNIFQKLGRWSSYLFIRASLRLFTFYFKQKV